MSDKSKTAGIIALAAVFFIADRAFKRLAVNVWNHDEFRIIGDWLSFRLTINSGIAFSLPLNSLVIVVFTSLAIFFMVYLSWLSFKRQNLPMFAALSIVIAGAYSNLLDRLSLHGVIDYLDLAHLNILNLADIMIACGIIAILLQNLPKGSQKREKIESAG